MRNVHAENQMHFNYDNWVDEYSFANQRNKFGIFIIFFLLSTSLHFPVCGIVLQCVRHVAMHTFNESILFKQSLQLLCAPTFI